MYEPVIYTVFLENKIIRDLRDRDAPTAYQNGCETSTRGCKEWLILVSIITNQAKK